MIDGWYYVRMPKYRAWIIYRPTFKNIKKIKYYEVPLDDGQFTLMDQKKFDKYTVGKPTDAIAKASGLIDYITFEMDGKNYAIPESKFESYIQKLKANEI